ncbi:glycosyl transferase [Geomonas sp. Red276]
MLPETSIVIAAFNEQERLPQTLRTIASYLARRGTPAEIVVVDDGSTDATAQAVREMAPSVPGLRLIGYPANRGKGYALRTGVLSARGGEVLVTDADLSTPIEELDSLRNELARTGSDIAIGSRALPASRILKAQPPWRRLMSRLFSRAVRSLVIQEFRDTQCGFKLFSARSAAELFARARIDRFAYDVEILALAGRHGFKVCEVPVSWTNSPASRVRPLRDSLQMLADLARIRFLLTIPKARPAIATVKTLDPEG